MKSLKFKPHLIEKILDGSKTTTWRLFDDKNLETGDEFEIINSDTKEVVGTGAIKYVTIKMLKDLDSADLDGHEKYENKEVMLENLRQYYGDKVNLETIVKIIKFELLK
ncbi:MAG: ASCH domain-containing protein [Candidatus Pacebacteria bacterium]|nr:ASCH domain-containing protein [Candidatus Paceibacterota bacterium]